jgi:hypothetical protein
MFNSKIDNKFFFIESSFNSHPPGVNDYIGDCYCLYFWFRLIGIFGFGFHWHIGGCLSGLRSMRISGPKWYYVFPLYFLKSYINK